MTSGVDYDSKPNIDCKSKSDSYGLLTVAVITCGLGTQADTAPTKDIAISYLERVSNIFSNK